MPLESEFKDMMGSFLMEKVEQSESRSAAKAITYPEAQETTETTRTSPIRSMGGSECRQPRLSKKEYSRRKLNGYSRNHRLNVGSKSNEAIIKIKRHYNNASRRTKTTLDRSAKVINHKNFLGWALDPNNKV